MRSRRAIFLAAALGIPASAHAAKDDVYAVVGARIVTVAAAVHENAVLVLRNGLIEAVGPGVSVPADARVIDGKGWTLTPGLIDGFGGVGLAAAPARAAGAAGPATPPPAAPAASPLAPQALALDKLRPAEALKARDTGVTTALVIPREGILPGQSVLINLSGEKAEGMVLKQPAALHLHMATLNRQYPGSLMGTVAYARQALYDAQRYRDEWAAYERSPRGRKRPRFDAALAAWQDVLAGKELLIVTASRQNDIRRALTLADEFNPELARRQASLRLVVAGAPQAARLAELIKARKLPLLVSVNFDPPKPVRGAFGGGGADEEKDQKDIEEAEKNPGELHKAGVPFALVSGHARDFLAGVRKAIDKGLPRDAALRAVTLGAAEVLGVADRTGSLEVGKIANVVAWSGDPLSKEAKVKLVFVDGQLYEPEEGGPAPGPRGTPAEEEVR